MNLNTTVLLQQLRLLQLASTNLPIGGFTYSQGLEWATETGWVNNENQFRYWQQQQISQTLFYIDWPILKRLYISCQLNDREKFQYWNQFLLSNRETRELRFEEQQRGLAFVRLLDGWGLCPNPDWFNLLQISQLGGIAWVGYKWKLPLRELTLTVGYNWLENAVMVGAKLVPFGHQVAQILLQDLCGLLAEKLESALSLTDDDLGAGLPLVAIASSRHETQYTRLFRS